MPLIPDRVKQDQQFFMDPVDAQRIGYFCVPPHENDDITSIEQDGVVRTPSDHLGLIVDL